ncbi:MAG: cytochrome c oxidase subunit II [Acidobacteria bacterium]|nr:MAG: cytochrome c oxidase subunit II [Acidobacteriota bacterium]REK04133.1 MAG: cytochrome c oxidase subunit II [Acidobacteriota bacterium]REK15295.1 MAG: cytochrome c oxidase subunit II [Acidobacteriota bacterium]REK46385.1 MAG: cytochrome c oxidase subunit II [Acidobacteriota bacterium]
MQDLTWVPLFPEEASSFAWQVDALYFYLIAVSLFFGVIVVAGVIGFAIKYREKEKFATPPEIHGSIPLELFWSFVPFVVSMTIFLGGAVVYYNQYKIPEDTMEIYVVGKQWMWKVQHGTGQREINELHVPVGRKVKLTMTTEDVLHDFFIPAFRTKADVVPGRYTTMWFEATKPGKYRLFCAEYCGLNHSGMGGWVYVMEQKDFDNWLAGNLSDQTPVQQGEDLFTNKLGCASCHAGGQNQRGAVLEGIFGKEVKLVGGQTVIADEEYIRNSILNPAGQVVEGYQPIMPTFKGQVTEEQLVALVAYIKSLSGDASATTAAPSAPAATMTPQAEPADASN